MMSIYHTLVKVGAKYIRREPKTNDSTRRIVLPKYIVDLLKSHKAEQAMRWFKAAGTWKKPELVFVNKSGDFYLGTNMNNKLKRVIAGTDLPQDLHLHLFRHYVESEKMVSDKEKHRISANYL